VALVRPLYFRRSALGVLLFPWARFKFANSLAIGSMKYIVACLNASGVMIGVPANITIVAVHWQHVSGWGEIHVHNG
jgi:hypothetical protein